MANSTSVDSKTEVRSQTELHDWLKQNHDKCKGAWLISYKKISPYYLPYDYIVEECLCFGWIDSLPRALDDMRSMHYLSPRKSGSGWSKLNKTRAEMLIAAGRMKEPGLAKIQAAIEDGSWSLLDDVDNGIAPDDLLEELNKRPKARENYEAFPPSSKKIILEWIKGAKRSETRRKRIVEVSEKAQDNIRANHYRQ